MILSEPQQKIVNYGEGALLVEAGPGSGKTRVLIERIKQLVLKNKHGKVLALTFSNLAADQMKTRLNEDGNFNDLVDRVTVGTIHSFCLDLVQSRGHLIGMDSDVVLFENEDDRKTLLKEVFLDNQTLKSYLEKQPDRESVLRQCLRQITEQKRMFIVPENSDINDPFPQIYSEYNRKLREQNAIDFDDILFYAYQILIENPRVVQMYNSLYKYICVDESQDLNYAQYQVIKALCGENFRNIMMVGDVNQSIYGFNGSNSDYMSKHFIEDFSPVVFVLNENFRSAKSIVNFADKLMNYTSNANYVYEGELRAFSFENESLEAAFVVDKISQLIRDGHPDVEGKLSANSFAVIARNRYVFNTLERKLLENNLPYYFKKTQTGIENESNVMRAFDYSIRLLINYRDSIHLNKLLQLTRNSNFFYSRDVDGITIVKNVLSDTEYSILIPAIEILNSETFQFLNAIKKIEEYLPQYDDNERYLISMDIEQWINHWNKYCTVVPRENRSLSSFRNLISLGKTSDSSADSGIALLTAHMSKGLQFDAVFIIGLCDGVFPDYRAIKTGDEQLIQETNNMYVAITRAKRLCYMTYPKTKLMPWGDTKFQLPSRYIKDIVQEG